jgi:hypothetical protein
MSCTNCYNGCVEITPDKCVRYTGLDSIPLGISNGDNLLLVEEALISNVVSFLDGTGIDITISSGDYCALVTGYLPVGRVPNAVELFTALVKAACSLQTQVTSVAAAITTLNADYDVDCLSGVTDSSDTHLVVQAIINKACATDVDLAALALDVDTNYVKLSELSTLFAAYLAAQPGLKPANITTGQRDAMVSPAPGLIIFNTTTSKLNVYTGSAWQVITSV